MLIKLLKYELERLIINKFLYRIRAVCANITKM
jgi:hypothetical protein